LYPRVEIDTAVGEDECLGAAIGYPAAAEDYKITDVDDRLSYRQGWPLLPILPVLSSRDNIPKALLPSSDHFAMFRAILKEHKITIHELEVVHRYNPGTPTTNATLTLCVLSEEKENDKWADTIRALRDDIQGHDSLTLAVEIVDHRVFHGLHTLRILPDEAKLTFAIKKKKHGVVHILNETGLEWTSLEFWWRGCGKMRELCRPTVLIGTPVPQRQIWYEHVKEDIAKKMGKDWGVEVCFRQVDKY
jgi:hypothetical protein